MRIQNLLIYFASFFLKINATNDTECPQILSPNADRRINNSTMRLVQYNTEWLFIDYCSSSNCPGNGCSWHTKLDAQNHLNRVAEVVADLNPDMINICEVEGCDELNILINSIESITNKASNYKPYLIKGTDTSTGQNVGMLTKIDPSINLYRTEERVAYPMQNTKCGTTSSSGTSGVSKHYITELKINNMNVAMIGAHLLAIPTDPSRCVQREAQAQVLQNIIYSYIQKKYEIMVLGDMNDYDMEILDMNSNKPTSRVLDILKGIEGDKKNTYSLVNVASLMNQTERYSDWWDSDNNCNTDSQKDYSMIDHVLVTPMLKNKILNVFIYHKYLEYCGKIDSDHYPVVIDFYNL